MNISDINTAIISGNFSNDELNSIVDAIKFKRARITQANTFQIRMGDSVTYRSRDGQQKTGVVQKVNRKNMVVLVNGVRWNVPANMLTKV